MGDRFDNIEKAIQGVEDALHLHRTHFESKHDALGLDADDKHKEVKQTLEERFDIWETKLSNMERRVEANTLGLDALGDGSSKAISEVDRKFLEALEQLEKTSLEALSNHHESTSTLKEEFSQQCGKNTEMQEKHFEYISEVEAKHDVLKNEIKIISEFMENYQSVHKQLDRELTGRYEESVNNSSAQMTNAGVGVATIREMVSNARDGVVVIERIHSLVFGLIVTHGIVVVSIIGRAVQHSATTTISDGGTEVDVNEGDIDITAAESCQSVVIETIIIENEDTASTLISSVDVLHINGSANNTSQGTGGLITEKVTVLRRIPTENHTRTSGFAFNAIRGSGVGLVDDDIVVTDGLPRLNGFLVLGHHHGTILGSGRNSIVVSNEEFHQVDGGTGSGNRSGSNLVGINGKVGHLRVGYHSVQQSLGVNGEILDVFLLDGILTEVVGGYLLIIEMTRILVVKSKSLSGWNGALSQHAETDKGEENHSRV